jgi:hypothetical protein
VVPFATFMAIYYRQVMSRLGSKEQQRDSTRSFVLTMAGFSFAALIGVVLVSGETDRDLGLLIYYLVVSFLAFMSAANVQRYKVKQWLDLASDAAIDIGNLALMLGVAAALVGFGTPYAWPLSITGLVLWTIDFVWRQAVTKNRLGGL